MRTLAGAGYWSGPSCLRLSTSSFDAILCRSKKPQSDTLIDTRWLWISTAGPHTASTHYPALLPSHDVFYTPSSAAASADSTTSAKLSKNNYIWRQLCIRERGLRCAQPGCCSRRPIRRLRRGKRLSPLPVKGQLPSKSSFPFPPKSTDADIDPRYRGRAPDPQKGWGVPDAGTFLVSDESRQSPHPSPFQAYATSPWMTGPPRARRRRSSSTDISA